MSPLETTSEKIGRSQNHEQWSCTSACCHLCCASPRDQQTFTCNGMLVFIISMGNTNNPTFCASLCVPITCCVRRLPDATLDIDGIAVPTETARQGEAQEREPVVDGDAGIGGERRSG